MALPQTPYWTEAEYLAFERESEFKHEYVNGTIIAMTGGSWNHNVITQNVARVLANQLLDKSCTVVASDQRLKVQSEYVSYRYPDVMVICGDPEFADDRRDTIRNPIVIVEVLSPSTKTIDREAKLDEYIQIDSVQEYLLVAQDTHKIERYRRQPGAEWLYTRVSDPANAIDITSISCQMTLAEVYDKVTFDPPPAPDETTVSDT